MRIPRPLYLTRHQGRWVFSAWGSPTNAQAIETILWFATGDHRRNLLPTLVQYA